MNELERINKEVEDKLKEILSKIKLNDKLEDFAIEIVFLTKLKFILNQYYKGDIGLKHINIEEMISYFYDYDLEIFNFLDEYEMMDFINNRLLEFECEGKNE